MTGTSSRTARVPIARWDLKEAVSKSLTRGTRIASEADHGGRGSVGFQSPMSSGTMGCICGGHGGKVTRLTLGDLSTCHRASSLEREGEGLTEVSRGHKGCRRRPVA